MTGITDSNTTDANDNTVTVIEDGGGSGIRAGVEVLSGKPRLLTSATVTIEQLFGAYPFADSWFRIENTGIATNTFTLTIAATTNDPSTPDRDVPLYTKIFTTQVSEVGDEETLAQRMVTELNQDATFNQHNKARKVKDNAIVHIESKKRGEFYNRPNANDFLVTTTGTASVTMGFIDFIARGKNNELAISEDDPRQGILGIAGSLSVQPGSVSDRFEVELVNAGSSQMAVNGSGTPVIFKIPPSLRTTTADLFINSIIIQGLDSGIKLKNFLGQNSPLTNGIDFTIKSDDEMFSFPSIFTTRGIKRFSTTGGWYLDIEAGGDDAMAIKELSNITIPIRAVGAFATDDYFDVTVNDNLTNVDDLKVILIGFKKEI